MTDAVCTLSAPYALVMAQDAPVTGAGPWGEAIRYWLKEKRLRQSHIVEGTGLPANTVSRAANGLGVRTTTLAAIADFLEVPFEAVLVSPLHRLPMDQEQRVAEHIAVEARRMLERRRHPARLVAPRVLALARRLVRLSAAHQKSILKLLRDYERIQRQTAAQHDAAARRRRSAPSSRRGAHSA